MRYLDLFYNYISFYNTVMKLVFLASSFAILWYMRYHKQVKQTYDKEQDTFRHFLLIIPCAVLALIINNELSVTEVRSF
jgi:ER lumen protein retaining receptor